MTFWDTDAEINLVSNKKPERHVHACEARSAFGSTDLHGSAPNTPNSNITSSSSSGTVSRMPSTVAGQAEAASSSVSPASSNISPGVKPGSITTAAGPQSDKERDASAKLSAHQQAVPLLPVPDLKETMDLYLKSLEGLVSAEAWARTKDRVDEFLAPSSSSSSSGKQGEPSVGEMLQQMLKEHADKTQPSWLESFWDDMYLTGRDPIPINVNYFFGFATSPKMHPNKYSSAASSMTSAMMGGEDDDDGDNDTPAPVYDETQINRAACLLHGAASVYNELRTGHFSLDYERKAPQCMSQYRRVFCSSRIPGEERDHIETCMPGLDLAPDEVASQTTQYRRTGAVPRHVVVLVRNRYFSVDVLDAENNNAVLSVEEIAKRLAYCVAAAGSTSATCGAPVGVFTTMNRTDWFHARTALIDLGNEPLLEVIQSALWLVALDTYSCSDMQETARILLHGPGTNRWFDRHELIVSRSGDAGINFEHSVGDGATTLRVADEMFRREKKLHEAGKVLPRERVRALLKEAEEIVKRPHPPSGGGVVLTSTPVSGINELRWKLDGSLDTLMRNAYSMYVELIQSTETTTLDFNRFGGDVIKKSGNSPDAFVQLSFQLTHHRLFGRPVATYESASTRLYSHGRTEVLRSCTRAATDFCILSADPIFTYRVNSQIPPQLTLLKNATAAHVDYMRRAKDGRGVDRHLFGLRHMAAKAKIPMPAVFTDENFKLSAHWGMSTSHCGSSALCLFGFGPVVPDGFGMGYMIKNDNISFCITSKYTHRYHSSRVFATMLEASLLHMRAIVDADWESRSKARPRAMEFSHPTNTVNDVEFDEARGFRYASVPKRSLYASTGMTGSGSFGSPQHSSNFPAMNTY